MIILRQKLYSFGLFKKKEPFVVSKADFSEGLRWVRDHFKYSKLENKFHDLCIDLDDKRIWVDAEINTFYNKESFDNDSEYLRKNIKSNEVWPVFFIGGDAVYYHKRLNIFSFFKDSYKERKSELDDKEVLKNKVQSPEKKFKESLLEIFEEFRKQEELEENPNNIKFLSDKIKWIKEL